jgi:hypothetical protein
MKRLALAFGLVSLVLLIWEGLYPDLEDPKNPHYVAWKLHLMPLDPKRALSTMTHDDAAPLVLGRNRQQLEHRFGFVREKTEVRMYLVDYCVAARPGKDAVP